MGLEQGHRDAFACQEEPQDNPCRPATDDATVGLPGCRRASFAFIPRWDSRVPRRR
jgi:hypothetical protein